MAATTEIERMVARLVGDSSSYTNMLKQAQRDSEDAARQVEFAGGRIQAMGMSLQGFAQSALATLGAFGTYGRLKEAFDLFAGQEVVEAKLTAAIEANGNAVEDTMNRYQEFAGVVSGMTTTSRQATLGLLQQAEQLGLTGAAAEQAVRQYVGAQAAGIPVNIRMIAAVHQGHTELLTRYIPALRGVKDPAERAAIATDFLNRSIKVAEAEANTISGQLKILRNSWQDFEKDLGKVISEGIKPVVGWFKELVYWLDAQNEEFKRNVVIIGAVITGILALVPVARLIMALYGVALFNPFVLGLVAATVAAVIFAHEVGGWQNALGIARGWLDKVGEGLSSVWGWVLSFAEANQKLVLGLALSAVAFAAVYSSVKMGLFLFGLLQATFVALRVQQVIGIVAWLAWNGVVIAGTLVLGAFQALQAEGMVLWLLTKAEVVAAAIAVSVWNAVVFTSKAVVALLYVSLAVVAAMFGSTTAMTLLHEAALFLWSGAVLVANAAIWLFNGALSATNVLLVSAGVIAAITTVLALAAAFVVAGAAVYAVFSTASTVLGLLLQLPTAYGPIGHIIGLFMQWWDILKDVYGVMTIDLDLATKLLYASFALAVNQIRDLWPPLWNFIKDGWQALTQLTSQYFLFEFYRVIIKVGEFMFRTIEEASGGHIKISDEFKNRMADTLKKIDEVEGVLVNQAGDRLKNAVDKFNVVEGAATAEARRRVEELQRDAKAKIAEGRKQEEPAAYDFGEAIGEQISRGLKDSKFDATLRNSTEALTRLTHYADVVSDISHGRGPVGASPTAGGLVAANDRVPNLLVQIRDELRNQEPMEFREAGLA